MPTMANITVTNVAAANVTYVAATPSAGDKSAAIWKQNALSSVPNQRPSFTVLTRDNAAKTARHLSISLRYPVTQTVSGVTSVVAVIPVNLECTLPIGIDSAMNKEAFHQFGNLISSSLVRSVSEEGYAPT